MPTALQLKEKRAQTWSQMQTYLDTAEAEDRDFTAEERAGYDKAEAELDTFTRDIERLERHANHATAFDAPPTGGDPTPEHRGPADTVAEQRKAAWGQYMRGGESELNNEQRNTLKEFRAQAAGTNSAGGYFIPPEFRDEFIVRMKAYGAVQSVAQVITTDSGANIQWPTMDDTSNVGAILAENTQFAEQDLTIGTANLDAYMYYSKLTRVSYQLLNDAAFDVEGLVQNAHAERIGRILNQHFTTGTGTAQPDGIVTGAASGVTAASATAITADELIDLTHSVDPAYRTSPRAQFMTSDTALKAVRKLKDSTGQYLWQPSMQAGTASSLFGFPYVVNVDMAVPATGVKSVLFGDFFAGYVIRIVTGIQRLVLKERYADFLQNGYASYLRADGTVQSTNSYKALTQA